MASRIFKKLFPSARATLPQKVPPENGHATDGTSDSSEKLDELLREVVSAKVFIKRLEAINSTSTDAAYDLLSFAEQRLALELLPGSKQWIQAWRSAVSAAVRSGNEERARALIIYLSLKFEIRPELIHKLERMIPRTK